MTLSTDPTLTEKKCGRCKQSKPITEFKWHEGKRPRYNSYCNPCRATYQAARRRTSQGLPVDAVLKVGGKFKPVGSIREHRGYIYEKVGDGRAAHHRADVSGYVPQHILVAEKKYGIKITEEFTVHHKNRIKHDNRPDNLELRVGNHGRGGDVIDTLLANEDLQQVAAVVLRQYGWTVVPPD